MWCTTVIPAYDGKFKASLSYTVNSRAAWAMAEILSQKKKKKSQVWWYMPAAIPSYSGGRNRRITIVPDPI
jgi:hypothetical protein